MLSVGEIFFELGKMLSFKEIALLCAVQTTCVFAYYSSYTVIKFLIWIMGMTGWWLSAITEGSLAMPLCIPGSILPSSHNTLDTPFLIIIFITLFARLNCLSEPQLWPCHCGVPFTCSGGERCFKPACYPKGEEPEKKKKRKINMTQRPPTLSEPLKVRNPSRGVRGKLWKDPS